MQSFSLRTESGSLYPNPGSATYKLGGPGSLDPNPGSATFKLGGRGQVI